MSIKEVDGNSYEIGKLDARRQFHVTRRLGKTMGRLWESLPEILPDVRILLLGALGPAPEGEDAPPAVDNVQMSAAFGRLVERVIEPMAELSDDDANFIIDTSLSVVRRIVSGGTGSTAPVIINGVITDAEMSMQTMLSLVFHVLRENLGGFFGILKLGSKLPS